MADEKKGKKTAANVALLSHPIIALCTCCGSKLTMHVVDKSDDETTLEKMTYQCGAYYKLHWAGTKEDRYKFITQMLKREPVSQCPRAHSNLTKALLGLSD